ncbi:MAG: LytTR family DNA-binding domain-containing protein [Myxococcota bacterium]
MTPTIRALLVDDEPKARARMRRLLEVHADVVVIGEADNGELALRQVLSLRPDVVFLDVRMPGALGTEVAQQLVEYLPEAVRPSVIFTTAHAEHAVDAFAVQGLDYVLKPVERSRLAEALRRVRQRLWARAPNGPVLPAPSASPIRLVLTGVHGAREEPVAVESILCVQVEDGVVFADRREGPRIRLTQGLSAVESGLPSPPFVRVSRSAIVHSDRVLALRATGAGTYEAELREDLVVAVSRRRAKALRGLIGLDSE